MYFVKSRKNIEEQDARDIQQRNRRDRHQRSDSARLVLQAVPTQQPQQTNESKSQYHRSDSQAQSLGFDADVDPPAFRPDELPDGACYRPRKDLTSLPSTSAAGTVNSTRVESEDIINPGTGIMEHIRPAEYIGTFSVSGSDKDVREKQMESQLQQMRNAQERRAVQLVISAAGVKVILPENNNVLMEHSLKRIWYATCDPDFCQFSFLAREPKTSAEVQYCHAFVTQSPDQAEELITLIGEAFRSTSSEQQPPQQQQHQQQQGKEKVKDQQQPKKQPTFHELIEQQVLQQQAKFREIEQEAQTALQQTLTQIATPTPFSERAQSRMEERRRQSEDLSLAAASRRDWAKHELQSVRHVTQSPERGHLNNGNNNNRSTSSSNSSSPAANPNRRSEIPTRQSTPKTSPFKRNSVPPQMTLSSSQPHPLSALAIKESMESKAASKNSKFKGSPVTALKNEIDRRLSMANGDELPPPPMSLGQQKDQSKSQAHPPQVNMANRPLPPPPASESHRSPQHSAAKHHQSRPTSSSPHKDSHQQRNLHHHHLLLQQQRSFDDYHLPRSSTSPEVVGSHLSSSPASRPPIDPSGAARVPGGVKLRDSPRRRQPRPMSEIATSSSGLGRARPGGSSYYEQQRASLLNNFVASVNTGDGSNIRADGMYIYGPGPAPAPGEGEGHKVAPDMVAGNRRSWAMEDPQSYRNYNDNAAFHPLPGQHHQQNGRLSSPRHYQQQHGQPMPSRPSTSSSTPHPSYAVVPGEANHPHQVSIPVTIPNSSGSPQHRLSNSNSTSHANDVKTAKVQNYQNEGLSASAPKQGPGLASLMCLDRSHIHDESLRNAAWYQAGLPRDIALDILQQEEVGAFIVRDSSTHPGCFALSVRVPRFENASGISHYLILKTQRGVKLKGLDKEWSTLAALVTHHTVMREMLPCTLRLPKVKDTSMISGPKAAAASSTSVHSSPSHSVGAGRPDMGRYSQSSVKTASVSKTGGQSEFMHTESTTTAISSCVIVNTHQQHLHHLGGGGGGGTGNNHRSDSMGFMGREQQFVQHQQHHHRQLQQHRYSYGGGNIVDRPVSGVEYTDNYSDLSEVTGRVGQLKM